jgi:hypothetical protein
MPLTKYECSNRLDRGVFEVVLKPYCFHQSINSVIVPLRMATSAKRQNFVVNLDPEIDIVRVSRLAVLPSFHSSLLVCEKGRVCRVRGIQGGGHSTYRGYTRGVWRSNGRCCSRLPDHDKLD